LVLSAVHSSAAQSVETPRAARESLLAAERSVAQAVGRAGLARGLRPVLAADGLLLFEGAPIVAGPEAAERVTDAAADLSRLRVEWLPVGAHLSPDRTLGVTYGLSVARDRGAGDTAGSRVSNYISVWRRADGRWTLAAHVQTGLLAGAGPTYPPVLPPAPTPAQRVDGHGAPFAAADRAFARLAADSGAATAFATFVAPTGAVFGAGGEILAGPDAIGTRMRENPNRTEWWWEPRFAEASADGLLGYTVGEAVIAVTRADGRSVFSSKYLTVWRRLPDGAIRFLVDGGNARPAPADSGSR
jgi:ketosteroid isomerase-like protein